MVKVQPRDCRGCDVSNVPPLVPAVNQLNEVNCFAEYIVHPHFPHVNRHSKAIAPCESLNVCRHPLVYSDSAYCPYVNGRVTDNAE